MSGPDGDDEATRLFRSERDTLLGVAYRLLGTMSDAEDVLQDVFERWLQLNRSELDYRRRAGGVVRRR